MITEHRYGPSSVTIDEAVAKLIKFDWIPEGVSLEEFLEALVDDSLEQTLELHEHSPSDAEKQTVLNEYHHLENLLIEARRLLKDIEACLRARDPMLKLAATDTSRTRLTTVSVAEWAEKRHDISVPEWRIYRGENLTLPNDLDHEQYEDEILFRAIVGLTNELLCRDWVDWKGDQPFRSAPTKYRWFSNRNLKIDHIKEPFLMNFYSTNDVAKSWRTISKWLTASRDFLKEGKRPETTKIGKPSFGYLTLLGLFLLLTEKGRERAPKEDRNGMLQFIDDFDGWEQFNYTQKYVRPEELANCLQAARRTAIKTDFWA